MNNQTYREKLRNYNKENVKQNDDIQIAIMALMKQHQGRYFLKYLLDILPLYEYSFSADPIRDAYANGRRSVALDIVNLLGEDYYQEILKEPLK